MLGSSSLKDILAEEASLLGKMVDAEEETQKLLLKGDAEALQNLNMQKEKYMQKLQELENKRGRLIPEKLTLKEYISRYNPPESAEMSSLRVSLLRLHERFKKSQEINRHLLQQNMQFVNYIISMLAPQAVEGQRYSPSGEVEVKNPGLFDVNA